MAGCGAKEPAQPQQTADVKLHTCQLWGIRPQTKIWCWEKPQGCFKHASWGQSLTKCCSASSPRVQRPFAVPLALALTNKLIDSAWLSRVLSNFSIEPQLLLIRSIQSTQTIGNVGMLRWAARVPCTWAKPGGSDAVHSSRGGKHARIT